MANALRLVTAEEGVLALWKGMAPSALRELSYSTLRFGLYKPIKKALGAGTPRDTPLWKMMAAGGASPPPNCRSHCSRVRVGRPATACGAGRRRGGAQRWAEMGRDGQ